MFKWNINMGSETYTLCIWQQPQHLSDNTRIAVWHRLQALVPMLHKFRYTLRKEGHGLLDEPLFHCLTNRLIGIEPPALQSLLEGPKHVTVTRGEIGAVRGVIQNTPAKTAYGVPCCVGSMWACVIVEYKHTLHVLAYGAEPFLRSCQLCSHSGNSQQF
jgi:hypothetical protein